MPATAGTKRMIRIQRRTAVCGGIVIISVDFGVTSSWYSGTASHLPRLEDLDGLDMRILAPAGGLAFGHRTASLPFGVAARRDACGPELARRVRGEVDHDAVRVDTPHAAAFVHLAGSIDGLELDPHACSVMKIAGSAGRWLTWPAHEIVPRCRLLLFAWFRLRDLLL